MQTEFVSDPGFLGEGLTESHNNFLLGIGTGTVIPDISTGQPNRTITTPPAGSVLIAKESGVESGRIRFPAL